MRTAVLLLLGLFLGSNVFSQEMIAKLKYEEAEEAFDKKQYEKTVSLLDETKKILGETNPKILYLRIMAQKETIAGSRYFNYSVLESFKSDADYYLKKFESSDEDKYRQVYKASQQITAMFPDRAAFDKVLSERLAEDRQVTEAKDKKDQAINTMNAFAAKYNFIPGQTLDQFSSANADVREFLSKAKRTVSGELVNYNDKFNVLAANPFKKGINAISTRNGVVVSVTYILNSAKKKEDSELMGQYADYKNWAVSVFGSGAIINKPSLGNGQFRVTTAGTNIYLEIWHYPSDIDFKWNCLMLSISDLK